MSTQEDVVLNALSRWTIYGAIATTIAATLATSLIGLLVELNWNLLVPRLLLLAAMPYMLYRTTLLLPGPLPSAISPTSRVETKKSSVRRRRRRRKL